MLQSKPRYSDWAESTTITEYQPRPTLAAALHGVTSETPDSVTDVLNYLIQILFKLLKDLIRI